MIERGVADQFKIFLLKQASSGLHHEIATVCAGPGGWHQPAGIVLAGIAPSVRSAT
jgi:hypothetical protein